MTHNPFLNACAALAYIVAIVLAIFYGGPAIGPKETILIPMAMLSLFVFSAATMGYIVLSQPIMLFLDGKKTEAVDLFIKTTGTLGGFMVVLFVLQFLASRYL